jgi:sarcosine oxidase, subunit beta
LIHAVTALNFQDASPRSAEVVVIGGGVIGAGVAFAARRAGLEAVVVEARPALAAATTAVATGAFRLQQDDPDELALVRESVAAIHDFAEYTGQAGYDPEPRAVGLLSLTTTEDGAATHRATVEHQRSIGVEGVELLVGEEARRRFPYLSPEVRSARLRMDDGVLDPRRLALGLLAGSRAPVTTRCRVTGFTVTDGRLTAVHTDGGAIATGCCVIAAGPVSGVVAGLAGIELPIYAMRRHRLVLPDVPQVPAWAPLTYDDDTGAHWRPGLRGAYVLISHPELVASEPVDDPPPDPAFPYQVLDPRSPDSVARLSPFWAEVWNDQRASWLLQCGQYTMTPDRRPLVGPTAVEGLHVSTGYSGHGVMCAIGAGRLLADLVTGARTENPFRLDREFREPPGKAR